MGLFSFHKKNDSQTAQTAKATETELVQRFGVFLDKLMARATEMHDELKASAQSVADADTDPFKRSFLQFKSGMLAQFTAIIQKGNTVYQNEVAPKASTGEFMVISTLFNDWQTKMLGLTSTAFDHVVERDLEKEYAEILGEYERYTHQFQCKQCGSSLDIQTFYFTATYIACPYCRTQNTFDPGTKVRRVEHLARPLAELRCRPLFLQYQEQHKQFGAKQATDAYKTYAQALVREMDGILPGLETQHQNFYNRLLSEYEHFEHLNISPFFHE